MLLEASIVSRAWRERTLDSRLWKRKFHLEGWDLEMEEVRRLEQTPALPRKTRSRRAETDEDQRRHKRRLRPGSDMDMEAPQEEESETKSHPAGSRQHDDIKWNEQHGAVEADIDAGSIKQESVRDQAMQDVDHDKVSNLSDQALGAFLYPEVASASNEGAMKAANSAAARRTSDISMEADPQSPLEREPPLVWYSPAGQPRLNYQQLYKQRRKLEENWNACAYKSFQLPHPDYPEEAHCECVYTIQYMGRYVVSGSRDQTLRKWDLETQRLVGSPMLGHSASVLCLQFDSSPKEDVIISGSSDTNVLIWRFSTCELLGRIHQAHKEPVLNLKFDARFLVTCSKDKTIKIWNRRSLQPGDRDYPITGVKGGGKCPSYIVDLSSVGTNPFDIHKYLRPDQREPLKEYTHLMTLDSHSAAVNAIHIYKDQLVSASGDRFVKIWNIHTGECTATCRGHQKGIACIQYDGKRIISGSSDNTIRIYDPATQAEVACLSGHTRLVRTIQSAFEDLPGSKEELQMEAAEVDRQFFLANGSEEMTSQTRGRPRNPGSSQPKHIMAVGAKLPPGGGGSRWGRILSGSYDETIIIWRKGSDGRWIPGHRLRQEEALRAVGGPLPKRSEAVQNLMAPTRLRNLPPSVYRYGQQQGQNASQSTESTTQNPPAPDTRARPLTDAQISSRTSSLQQTTTTTSQATFTQNNTSSQSFTNPTADSSSSSAAGSLRNHLSQQQQTTSALASSTNPFAVDPTTRAYQPFPGLQSPFHVPRVPGQYPGTQPSPFTSLPATSHQPAPPQNTNNNIPPVPPLPANMHNQANRPNPQPHHHHPAPAGGGGGGVQQPNARVFKLQFDARRIICCSQDPKIVGWDFANGDERIIEASRFFGAPQ